MYGNRHKLNIGYNMYVKDGGTIIKLASNKLRETYKHHEIIAELQNSTTMNERYRLPPKLIEELFNRIEL